MPKLSDFKALLFDVDKTLSNSARKVTPRTQNILQKLGEKKLHLGVCTGRHHSILTNMAFPYFPKSSLHITCGGSQIVKTDGTVMWERTLPPELCKEIQEKATALGMGTNQPAGPWYYANQKLFDRYTGKDHLVNVIKPIDQLPHWNAPVLVVTEVTEEFIKYIETIPEVSYKRGITSINTTYIDITPVGVNKSLGIAEWSKLTGIEMSEIIGFGDADNDVEFLSVVGFSVAMGNATDEIKASADRVIGHTDEDGLAVYLEQILEGAEV